SGSGEPTLYAPLAELIDQIKDLTDTPIAVLTNGSLLWQPHIRQALRRADLVAPSLDAGSPTAFQKINRPHPDITFDKMLDGLIQFRQEFSGQMWLEVFIIEGINTDPPEIQNLTDCIARIDPDRIQVNTATRPTADPAVKAVSFDMLHQIATQLSDKAEVIADFPHLTDREFSSAQSLDVLNLLKRRPCSLDDIAAGLNLKPYQATKYVEELLASHKITEQIKNNKTYYFALDQPFK
ncbi:MAG: radical SAM protein, partial [Planctomycetes bacterium]|nr:radical SAM protein [Planctomycetota bacterium]